MFRTGVRHLWPIQNHTPIFHRKPMTYHLWHNGTDTGPYTREEIAKRHARGELVGVLWRRTGDTQFHPHTELGESLSPPAPNAEDSPAMDAALLDRLETCQSSDPEPSGFSAWGMTLSAVGGCLCIFGIIAALVGASLAGLTIEAGLTLVVVGTLLGIRSKLDLIAHRLRR
jgi:hypothetical protein